VLLTDSELASQILDRLSGQKLGKAALLPQDFATMRAVPDRQLVPEGGIAWAVDKVRAKPGVQELTDRLLDNVLIVADLHTALRLKRQLRDIAIATLAGEFIAADGVIHGGATKEEAASMLRREAELKNLRLELEGYEMQLLEREEAAEQIRLDVEQMQQEEVSLREQSQRAREGFSTLTGKLSIVQRALQQAVTKLESVECESLWQRRALAGRHPVLCLWLAGDNVGPVGTVLLVVAALLSLVSRLSHNVKKIIDFVVSVSVRVFVR
jgi:chromosome segregation protein